MKYPIRLQVYSESDFKTQKLPEAFISTIEEIVFEKSLTSFLDSNNDIQIQNSSPSFQKTTLALLFDYNESTIKKIEDYRGNTPLWFLQNETGSLSVDSITQRLFHDILVPSIKPIHLEEALKFWTQKILLFSNDSLKKLIHDTSEELSQKILKSFCQSLEETFQRLMPFLTQLELDEGAKAAHYIKASAKMVGAEALYNLCNWFEIKRNYQSPLTPKFNERAILIFKDTMNIYNEKVKSYH